MDRNVNTDRWSSSESDTARTKKSSRQARGDCDTSESSSHTQIFRKKRYYDTSLHRITGAEYCGISESISSSDTFHCVHGPEGKQYTPKGLLKRNLIKKLDPIPTDKKWTADCAPAYGWDMARKLVFLMKDPTVEGQRERLLTHLHDFVKIADKGYRVDVLNCVCVILDILIETLPKNPEFRQITTLLLQITRKPIMLTASSDICKYFDDIRDYLGFLGYLLLRVEEDSLFDEVSGGLLWQLSEPDRLRPRGCAPLRHSLAAAAPALHQTVARMLALATEHRFPTFLTLALLLACDSYDNCIELMKENILENVFYRFNPYFPDRKLPAYEEDPVDPQDMNIKLGDSSKNLPITISLLLVLVKTMKQCLEENPQQLLLLPCPDVYSVRCFMWAYRYECRARDHRHQRTTLTIIAHVLLHCFGERLSAFSTHVMPDVLSLSVLTELPPRDDWTRTVNFNTTQQDVQFKKALLYFAVDCIKTFSANMFMLQDRCWLLGLGYLIDPGLGCLRAHWAPSLFAEIRKVSLQALVCVVPLVPSHIVKDYGLIRRTMWYIEWYSECPYELTILYWCTRLLQIALFRRDDSFRNDSLKELFDSHGIIIVINLCYKLLAKFPPVEKSSVIISLCLRVVTSAIEPRARVKCCVYPDIKWPAAINALAQKMLDCILYLLEKNYIVSDRWMVALLNFIWEAVIWSKENRNNFIKNDGVYNLLDIITMTRAPVQCIALALVCDVARGGAAVAQLVTWRAKLGASNANPRIVKRGATIATLLASIFRDECAAIGVRLDYNGVVKDPENPIMASDVSQEIYQGESHRCSQLTTPVCVVAGDVAGSRMAKAFAILQMLSDDLEYKVALADEAYNLYKNIKLTPEDEVMLVLCSNYLTLKLNEVWTEIHQQSSGLLPPDKEILEEFLHIGRGWAKEIRRQQKEILEKSKKKEKEEEYSLYEFLGRVRLNISLDALVEVRCVARSADRARRTLALLQDAVRAHHRRSVSAKKMAAPLLRTYGPNLDDFNITGQNVKVYSIHPKNKPKPRHDIPSS